MNLTDKTVIVTGAGSGIGRALALEFGRHRAKVVCAAWRSAAGRSDRTPISRKH
jgi:NAD(P)-dependent dehydrogenase (short-subunit alcohol dehydrogenase family)